jgi:hypothetical protein
VIKAQDPSVLVLVDNCYGEFMEEMEPTAVGAGEVGRMGGGGQHWFGGGVASGVWKEGVGHCEVLVDDCYGEFTEEMEPTAMGAGGGTGIGLAALPRLVQIHWVGPHRLHVSVVWVTLHPVCVRGIMQGCCMTGCCGAHCQVRCSVACHSEPRGVHPVVYCTQHQTPPSCTYLR